ncbi:MAG: hypothetical protein V4850_13900 [Myxococcota bacterium]
MRFRSRPYVLAIYLGGFVLPGVGSTLACIFGRAAGAHVGLAAHYHRALQLQAACVVGMLTIQAVVVALLASGFPWGGSWGAVRGPPEGLRGALVLAGVYQTVGLYLVMGALGPILALAARRGAPVAATSPRRRTPMFQAAPTRRVSPDRRILVPDRRIHAIG